MTDLYTDDQSGSSFFQQPHDIVAEESVLGALLLSPQARLDVIGGRVLDDDDWYVAKHRMVWEAIRDLEQTGVKADASLVASELGRRGELNRVGGLAFLHTLLAGVPSASNATYYAREVRQAGVLRRMQTAAVHVQQLATTTDGRDADEILAEAQKVVADLDGVGRFTVEQTVGEVVSDIVASLTAGDTEPQGTQWDWPWLEFRQGYDGLPFVLPARPGQFIVFGGRPAQGKSTALISVVRKWSILDGARTVFYSKEMPKPQIIERILSAEAKVPYKRLRAKQIHPDEWDRIYAAMERIEAAPLEILTQGGTITDIVAAVRKYKADVVAYDYLQLAPVGNAKSQSDRGMLVGQFAQDLKNVVALDQNVVVASAAQLNRENVQGKPTPPGLHNFRETGSIEQAIDLGILIHREDAYEKETIRAGEADFIVAKQRDGETGTRVMAAQLHLCRFVDCVRPT